jgi:enoyl-CoA hydratase/carnithine racemase
MSERMSEQVHIRRDGAVLEIVLDRADRGNALTAEMGEAIIEALRAVDGEVKLVRLGAAGPDFCGGRDSPIPTLGAKPSAETVRRKVALPPLALYDAIKAVPAPVLSVVRGRAVGAGCALACVADLVVCADDAVFQIPEMERDIPPTLVMAALADRVPVKTLAQMVYSRAPLGAIEARAAGLVSHVVPAAQLDAAAGALVETMLGNSAVTLRAVKQFLALAPGMPAGSASAFAGHLAATALSIRF